MTPTRKHLLCAARKAALDQPSHSSVVCVPPTAEDNVNTTLM
jgi:hypothetical protein